jgi:dTDP-4-dehydrorhamnose 3,5-epimerase
MGKQTLLIACVIAPITAALEPRNWPPEWPCPFLPRPRPEQGPRADVECEPLRAVPPRRPVPCPSLEHAVRMEVRRTSLPEVLVVEHEVFEDERGFFMEVYRSDQFAEHADLGLPSRFVQLNHSRSAKGVTRGLHFQWDPPMGKLMRVVRGEAFLVAVDIRPGSPTVGQYESIIASDRNRLQLWAPASFARGFCALSEVAEVEYLTTGTYNSAAESGVRWNDPRIGIEWPIAEPILSRKDAEAQSLAEWLARPEAEAFRYGGSERA